MKLVYERQDLHDLVLSDAHSKGLISGEEGAQWSIEWVRAEAGPFGPDHIELTIGDQRSSESREIHQESRTKAGPTAA